MLIITGRLNKPWENVYPVYLDINYLFYPNAGLQCPMISMIGACLPNIFLSPVIRA
jgi:hypothetical protein